MSGDLALSVVDYLKSPALRATAEGSAAATWGDLGLESSAQSSLYNESDAQSDAAAHVAAFQDPPVEDAVTVRGRRKDLVGKVINLTGSKLDYSSTPKRAIVIGCRELPTGMTELVVIRSLGS